MKIKKRKLLVNHHIPKNPCSDRVGPQVVVDTEVWGSIIVPGPNWDRLQRLCAAAGPFDPSSPSGAEVRRDPVTRRVTEALWTFSFPKHRVVRLSHGTRWEDVCM